MATHFREANIRIWARALMFSFALVALVHSGSASAQQVKSEGNRKMVTVVNPTYPPLARKLNLGGKVKLVAVIGPDGRVVRTEALGGSPVLVKSAQDAIASSKWEPGSGQTKEVIEVTFQASGE